MRYKVFGHKDDKIIGVFEDGDEAEIVAQEDNGYIIQEHACRGCVEYKEDTQVRHDFHNIYTGYWCENCYETAYTYRKDDYTHGTGICDDGTPIDNDY
jgi:hypothetical protein